MFRLMSIKSIFKPVSDDPNSSWISRLREVRSSSLTATTRAVSARSCSLASSSFFSVFIRSAISSNSFLFVTSREFLASTASSIILKVAIREATNSSLALASFDVRSAIRVSHSYWVCRSSPSICLNSDMSEPTMNNFWSGLAPGTGFTVSLKVMGKS